MSPSFVAHARGGQVGNIAAKRRAAFGPEDRPQTEVCVSHNADNGARGSPPPSVAPSTTMQHTTETTVLVLLLCLPHQRLFWQNCRSDANRKVEPSSNMSRNCGASNGKKERRRSRVSDSLMLWHHQWAYYQKVIPEGIGDNALWLFDFPPSFLLLSFVLFHRKRLCTLTPASFCSQKCTEDKDLGF